MKYTGGPERGSLWRQPLGSTALSQNNLLGFGPLVIRTTLVCEQWCAGVVFICISLMTNDIEYLLCALLPSVKLFVKYLLIFCLLLSIRSSCFLIWIVRGFFFYIYIQVMWLFKILLRFSLWLLTVWQWCYLGAIFFCFCVYHISASLSFFNLWVFF